METSNTKNRVAATQSKNNQITRHLQNTPSSANEKFLPSELDFDNYDFVTILRDPWERYISHFVHDFRKQKRNMSKLKLKFDKMMVENSTFSRKNFTEWAHSVKFFTKKNDFYPWVSGMRDNYFTRKICGRECMEIPRGKLDESHLEKAKSRLDKFSAVMILENLNESLEILSSKFNWTIPAKYQKTKTVDDGVVNHGDRSDFPGIG